MARRNLFQPPAPPETPTEVTAPDTAPRFPNTGAMSGVKSTLKDLSSNAVRDISPDLIDDSGPKDRLAFTEADIASLAESIGAHGQQVPIMVRPIAGSPNRYQIVYGRRRLLALRKLGIAAKALVRSLSDEQAILAQGQENAQRLDPSFIEKALFADELMQAKFDPKVIVDALATDRPMLSRMTKVARSIPASVVQAIGPAHGTGRRRWEHLADVVRDTGLDLAALTQELMPALSGLASDARFSKISDAVDAKTRAPAPSSTPNPAISIAAPDGTPLAQIKETARAVTLTLPKTGNPAFSQWMRDNAEAELQRLYAAWQSTQAID